MSPVWLLVPLYLLPAITHNEVVLTILVYTFILSIMAIGFNVVFGYAGQLTMFHAAAFGIGAYATYLFATGLKIPFWLALIPAIAIVVVRVDRRKMPSLRLRATFPSSTDHLLEPFVQEIGAYFTTFRDASSAVLNSDVGTCRTEIGTEVPVARYHRTKHTPHCGFR